MDSKTDSLEMTPLAVVVDHREMDSKTDSLPPATATVHDTTIVDRLPDGATAEDLKAVAAFKKTLLARAECASKKGVPHPHVAHRFVRTRLLQFLRARKMDEAAAVDMFIKSANWLKDWEYAKKVELWENEKPEVKEFFQKFYPAGLYGVDKRGVGVLITRLGLTDYGGLVRETSWETVLRREMHLGHTCRTKDDQFAEKDGRQFIGRVIICDYTGFSWRRIMRSYKPFTRFLQIEDNNFPERLVACYCVNTPWLFNAVYKLVSPLLAEETKEKVKIFGAGEDFLTPLQKLVSIDQIPTFLGGKCTDAWPYGPGGDVERGVYNGVNDVKKLNVSKVETLEKYLKPGDTCVWEYRVMKHDIDCEVLSAKSYEDEDSDNHTGVTVVSKKKRMASSDGWQHGTFSVPSSGTSSKLTFTFDNSFSWTRTKDIEYRISVLSPESTEGDTKIGDTTVGSKEKEEVTLASSSSSTKSISTDSFKKLDVSKVDICSLPSLDAADAAAAAS